MRRVTCAALLVVGCSSEPADIGSDRSGEKQADYAGIWDGYTQAFEVEPGSSRLRLTLDAAGQGTARFGDAPLLPAPDPKVGYPPNLPTDVQSTPTRASHVAGFEYPAHDAALSGSRISFKLKVSDHFTDWCQAQTPVARDGDEYGCLANAATGSGTDCGAACCIELWYAGSSETTDCLRYNMCMFGLCRCTAAGCQLFADYYFPSDTLFDATLQADGNEMVGSMSIAGPGPLDSVDGVRNTVYTLVRVHLTRQ